MKRSKAIKIPIYGDKVYVFTSPEQINQNVIKFADPYEPYVNGYQGAVADSGGGTMLMYISTEKRSEIIESVAHECYHAVMGIMDRVGQSVSCKEHGGEHVAYLLGWLVKQVHKEIERLGS